MDANVLQELGINIDDIKEDIIQRAAAQIAERSGVNIERNLVASAKSIVDNKVNEIVEQVLSQTFQPVNSWGEKTGEPTTVRDLFEKSVLKWWSEKVDSSGKPSSYSSNQTRAEYFAKEVVGKYVDVNLKSEMAKIVNEGKDKVRQAMAKAIDELIKKSW